jgi:hypothetical protein
VLVTSLVASRLSMLAAAMLDFEGCHLKVLAQEGHLPPTDGTGCGGPSARSGLGHRQNCSPLQDARFGGGTVCNTIPLMALLTAAHRVEGIRHNGHQALGG